MGGCTLSFLDREMDDGGGCTLHLLNARLTTLLHERIDRSGRQIRVHSCNSGEERGRLIVQSLIEE